jgi:hypothetical protein
MAGVLEAMTCATRFAVVTGDNTGLGLMTVKLLAAQVRPQAGLLPVATSAIALKLTPSFLSLQRDRLFSPGGFRLPSSGLSMVT